MLTRKIKMHIFCSWRGYREELRKGCGPEERVLLKAMYTEEHAHKNMVTNCTDSQIDALTNMIVDVQTDRHDYVVAMCSFSRCLHDFSQIHIMP